MIMAKGYDAHRERQELLTSFGKALGKRAGFTCEWCAGKDDLRPWEFRPDREPEEGDLALLCRRCREVAGGRSAEPTELHAFRNALWSDIPAVAGGAARVLVRSKLPWAREAIEESIFDEELREEIFKGTR